MQNVTVQLLPIEECRLYGFNLTENTNTFVWENGTIVECLGHAPVLTNSSIVKSAVLGALAILSFVGNTATIVSIRRGRRARRLSRASCSAIYSLIMHLSIADLLVTAFCLAGESAWSYTVAWLAGNIACKLFKFLQMFSLYLSTFVMVLVGVDRFIAVRYPMKSLSTAKRGTRLIVFVWVLSALLSIPQMLVFHEARGPFIEEFYQCVTHGSYSQRWQEQLYAILSLLSMFIVPLGILTATYAATFITIAKSEKAFKEEIAEPTATTRPRTDLNRRRLIHKAKMKSLRISVVIVVAFVFCWTPYYIMMIIFMFLDPDQHISEELQSGIFFFGMSNSLVNPVIYGAFQMMPQKRDRSVGSQRESMYNHRSTIHQNSVMRRGSTRILAERMPLRGRTCDSHFNEEEETALVCLDQDQLSRRSSRDTRHSQSNGNKSPEIRADLGVGVGVGKIHQNNNKLNGNGDVSKV